MRRDIALTVTLLLAGAAPALAQAHPYPHPPAHSHNRGHVRPDSAHHAAMHALLLGHWSGTLTLRGIASGLDLSIGHDSLQNVSLTTRADRLLQAEAVRDLVLRGDTLRWTQNVSGTACVATAVVSPATMAAPGTMNGTIACEHGPIPFTLHKRTG